MGHARRIAPSPNRDAAVPKKGQYAVSSLSAGGDATADEAPNIMSTCLPLSVGKRSHCRCCISACWRSNLGSSSDFESERTASSIGRGRGEAGRLRCSDASSPSCLPFHSILCPPPFFLILILIHPHPCTSIFKQEAGGDMSRCPKSLAERFAIVSHQVLLESGGRDLLLVAWG
jgi:hypothetical protein